MDKITVVCHKDHDKGYEDYAGKCLLCEVERLQKREWVGMIDEESRKFADKHLFYQPEGYEVSGVFALARAIEAKLKEKNA